MLKNRIAALCWTTFLLIYGIASDSYLILPLLVITIGMFLYLAITVYIVPKYLHIALDVDGDTRKRTEISGRLLLKNHSYLPIAKALLILNCENVLTKEQEHIPITFSIRDRYAETILWNFQSEHCGKVVFTIDKVSISDALGIFKKDFPTQISQSLLVMPDTFYTYVDITNRNVPNMDSDYYSDTKKGFDAGETFGIRDYVPGDSTKFIHWKLTNKLDKVVIRELGFPIQNSIALFFETGYPEDNVPPENIDAMVEALASVSGSLCEQQLEHHIVWYDTNAAQILDYHILDDEVLTEVISLLLSCTFKEDKDSVLSKYLDSYREFKYAHTVYISSYIAEYDMEQIQNISSVTVLQTMYEDADGAEGLISGNISVVPFYPFSMKDELSQLNI